MAWNHLQSASKAATSSSSNSATVTFTTANLSSGSKMIIAIGWASGSTQTVSTVKDGAGNAFTRMAGAPNSGGPSGCDLWQLDTPAGDVGTKPTITVQFSGSVSASLLVQEVSGLATGTTTAAVLDGTAGTKTGSGGSSTGSPTYSSSLSSEYLVTVYGDDGGPETLGTPTPPGTKDAATVSANSFADCGIGYGNSTGTTEAGSWPLSGTSAEWGVILVAFKLAAGGTTVTASGDAAVVATGRAQGATTKPVSPSRPAVAAISAFAHVGTIYYVSPTGSDSNNGTSTGTAWQTITHVNAQTFYAGDTILFQGGQTFSGTLLFCTWPGLAASPITIGSYGTGNATISNGSNDAIYVQDVGGYVFENLNVTGISGSTSFNGIEFFASGTGQLPAIEVTGCEITGWKYGFIAGGSGATDGWNGITLSGSDFSSNVYSGVLTYGATFSSGSPAYNHQDVLVENCTANSNTGSSGVTTQWTGSGITLGSVSGGTISGCVAHGNGADNGDTSNGPVGIWCYASQNVTITGCVSYSNVSGTKADGDGFDIDVDCNGCTVEYCIAYSNSGAGILLYGGTADSYWGSTAANTARYNMCWGNGVNNSEDSSYYGEITLAGNATDAQVFNNTCVAVTTGSSQGIPFCVPTTNTLSGCAARNNLLYTASTGQAAYAASAYATSALVMQGNLYYSTGTFAIYWGTSYASLTAFRAGVTNQETYSSANTGFEANPDLVNPSSAPTVTSPSNLSGANGLQVTGFSPCNASGLNLQADFSISPGTQDFFGNPVAVPLWIGAFQPLAATASLPAVAAISASATVGIPGTAASGSAAAVAAMHAAGATTKPASADRPAVAARAATGQSTKPGTGSRPAVAAISASASVGIPSVNVAGDAAAVATGRAAGQSTKPATSSRPAVASGRATGATTKPVSATRPAVAAIRAGASVNAGQPIVVQQVSGGDTSDYGMSSAPITTTAGNGIVVFAGWDLHNAPTTGPVPVVYVADSAGNYWYHLGTSSVGGYGSRCAIWACPNARSVDWVSVSLTAFASSLAYLIVEFENFPDFVDLDVEYDGFVNAGIPSMQAFTSAGSGLWFPPPGVVSVDAQCWAAGGGGSGGVGNAVPVQGGAGGGGGEYAQEATLAVVPLHGYAWEVGQGGVAGQGAVAARPTAGGIGGATSFAGSAVTVMAHGGGGGHIPPSTGGAGGTGSGNTIHFNGGAGGAESAAFHGQGGGSSAGTASAGASVSTDVKTAALAVAGGGPGGPGGDSVSPYYGYRPESGPGGGGGGGGANNKNGGNGGHGADGQIILTWSVSTPTELGLAATTTTADIAFTLLAAGSGSTALSAGPSSPWQALDSVAIGTTDGMTIFPYWAPAVSASTTLTPSWTVTPDVQLSGVLAALEFAPATPVQSNPNFPNLKVEIAEGFQPGDPTAIPPTWTDITARCMGKSGDAFITVTYGQQYELATPEAGEMVIGVNNLDGAFTPGNPTSPYAPYVVLGMPVRVSAYWDGSWYQVGFGYVERWPTEWPDLPQWGLSKLTCTDSIAVLNSATMPSALQGDILADGPYMYLPCNEQYLTYINGLTTSTGSLNSYSSAEAAGLLAANLSRVNQRAGAYCDGITATMETGSALNLFGDQGTGGGASSVSGNVPYTTPATGPGVIYNDPAMPDPTNADGVSIELWFVYSLAETSGQGLTLFQAFGTPSSYWPTAASVPTGIPPTSFVARLLSTSNEIQIELNGTQVNAGAFTPSGNPQQLVLTFPPTGGTGDLLVYYNGGLLATVPLSGGETTAWTAVALGPCTYAYSASPLVQNYTAGHWAIYPYTLSAARVAAHYSTGAGGAAGSTISQGAAQILSWGYLGIPRGGPTGFGPAGSQISDGIALGPFYSLDGSSAGDGLNAAILSDGGMMYAAPSGVLTVLPRWALFNEAVAATLGDATDGSQVPYQMGQAYDFDNTYVYNIVSVTRNDGPTTSITVTVRNAASQLAYFTRSALQQTISTSSDEDAYTLSNWEAGQYAQPQMRVRQVSIDAASNPAVAFPVVLPMTVSSVVTVDRDPVGGVPISGQFLTQRVSISIGPTLWKVDYQLSPYVVQAAVLTSDTSTYNEIGLNALG